MLDICLLDHRFIELYECDSCKTVKMRVVSHLRPILIISLPLKPLNFAGADTGFRKGGGGGPGNCLVLKGGVFAHTCATFFPLFMKFGGPPKGEGPDPLDPPPPLSICIGAKFRIYFTLQSTILKPIFHCDAKTFALGPGIGLAPKRHFIYFTLGY